MSQLLVERLTTVGRQAGLSAMGTTPVGSWTSSRSQLEKRRSVGLSSDMEFTYRNPARSTESTRILRNSRSLFVAALSYLGPYRAGPTAGSWGRVADYAAEEHYAELRTALGRVAEEIRSMGGRAVVLVDDNALVDREAAWRAGLGWYGKNANLLLPGAGSFFVLGSVATDLELERLEQPKADGCGTCTRCVPACPTDAIVGDGVIDARRCLSWLLQAQGSFPKEFRVALGDKIYGCDDCQDVCPPNRVQRIRLRRSPTDTGFVDVHTWLALDDEDLMELAGAWYIAGRDPNIVRRNLLIVLGNTTDTGDVDAMERARTMIARYRAHSDPVLQETAQWAGEQLCLARTSQDSEDGSL